MIKQLLTIGFVLATLSGYSQDESNIQQSDSIINASYNDVYLKSIEQQEQFESYVAQSETTNSASYQRKLRRDSIRANKKIWATVLGGPSYTPEASFGVGGALLASFRLDNSDSVSFRSFLPIGFNISINGTMVVAGAGTLFFKENRFRIYSTYGYRNEPAHYYGKGIESIESNYRSDSTTLFHKQTFQFNPRFVWSVRNNFYLGALIDLNYTKGDDFNEVMLNDEYFNLFEQKYFNSGIGGIIQYDTRDDVATPFKGVYLSAMAKIYGKYLGGDYNYQLLDLEYRQFVPLMERTTLAVVARSQIGFNDVPYTELPSFGSPFDLRGYYLGQYRDKSMGYAIAEYRQMIGSMEAYEQGRFYSKLGYVLWAGVGTLGDTPAEWTKYKYNYGVGFRIQIQPRKNFRIDVGKAHGQEGVQFYLNMTEAF